MGNKISKILETALARITFDMTKAEINHSYKDHIAIELLREKNSMACGLLTLRLKEWELEQIPYRIKSIIKNQPLHEDKNPADFLRDFRASLQNDYPDAYHISSAHALLSILSDHTTATTEIMSIYGITAHSLRLLMDEVSTHNDTPKSNIIFTLGQGEATSTFIPDNKISILTKFGTDLTELARKGKIDPIIGRDSEIARTIEILSRRKKNNPILIGEAGVGKSAIVEGLALRIISGDVPFSMHDKRIFSLDVASLIAGTKFRGELEERMQQLLEEVRGMNNTIIFIDEIHTIVGAGATQGSLDTANILKPALARGDIQTIGATTLDEYRENIECDSALERRFQRVMVEPTTSEQTLAILKHIAPHYEAYHNVKYTNEALQACISLTERYISDRHFPDKAIDALDEAGARCHIRSMQGFHNFLLTQQPTAVSVHDMENVITTMTGIPLERISHNEAERLMQTQKQFRGRVTGQQETIKLITRSFQRSRIGLKDKRHPIGVFMFVGPTGVGKTLLAKELSKWIFDQKHGLIRIDMSEYAQQHNVSRLIDSPPGYVGYGEGGQLTESVRRHPYSVILFDEIEKAHPDVYNTMLQIFDEGHLTDGSGRRVDFSNTIIILTSNIGSQNAEYKKKQVGYNTLSKEQNQASDDEYRKALEQRFAPEFLNRIDDIIYFRTLSNEDVLKIIDLELQDFLARINALGYTVEISHEAKIHLAKMGFKTHYGVRSLRRTLITHIEEPLSALILERKITAGGAIKILCDNNEGITLQVA